MTTHPLKLLISGAFTCSLSSGLGTGDDPDVKALMRISQVYDIPMAVNKSTADFMITSCYMNRDYKHEVINFKQHIADRAETL